jgi:hypothetical protein
MKNPKWYTNEFHQGENHIYSYLLITDNFYIEFHENYYTSFYPEIFLEERITLHPFHKRPGNIGIQTREEAETIFENWEKIEDIERIFNIPYTYQKAAEKLQEIYWPHKTKN